VSGHSVRVASDGMQHQIAIDGVDLGPGLVSCELRLRPGSRPVLVVELHLVDVTGLASAGTELALAGGHQALIAMGWTPPNDHQGRHAQS